MLAAGAVPERWQSGDVFSVRQQPGGGRLLAAACSDGALRTWVVAEGGGALRAHRRAPCHRSIGSAVAWAPDGAHLASVSKDGEVVLWVRKVGVRVRVRAASPARGIPPPWHRINRAL